MPTTRSRSAALAAAQANRGRRLRSSTRVEKSSHPPVQFRARKAKRQISRQIRSGTIGGGVLAVAGPQNAPPEMSSASGGAINNEDRIRNSIPHSLPSQIIPGERGEDIQMSGTVANAFILQPDSPLTRVDRPGKIIRYHHPDPEVTAALDQLLVEGILGRLPPGASYSVHLTRRSSRDPDGTVVAAAARSYRASASAFTSSMQQSPAPAPRNVPEESSGTAQMVSDARREFLGMQLNSTVPDGRDLLHMPEDGLPVGYQTIVQDSPAARAPSHVIAAAIEAVTVSPGTDSDDGAMLGGDRVAIVAPENWRRSVVESYQNSIPAYETFRAWRRVDGDVARERHSGDMRIPGRRQHAPSTPPLPRIVTPRTILGLEELFGVDSDIPEAESPLSDKILWARSSMHSGSTAMPSAVTRAQRQVVDIPARGRTTEGPEDYALGAYGSGGEYVEEPTIRDTEPAGLYVTQAADFYVEEPTIPDTEAVGGYLTQVVGSYVSESTIPDTPDNGIYVEESTVPDTPSSGLYVAESTIPDTPDTVRLSLTD